MDLPKRRFACEFYWLEVGASTHRAGPRSITVLEIGCQKCVILLFRLKSCRARLRAPARARTYEYHFVKSASMQHSMAAARATDEERDVTETPSKIQ